MQIKHPLLLILSIALLPLSTQAQAGNGPQNKGKGHPRTPSALIERLDTDQNGTLSKDEAGPRMARQFDRIDTNNDGVITKDEATAANRRRLVERFDRIDANSDGELSKKEMHQFHKEMKQRTQGNGARGLRNP